MLNAENGISLPKLTIVNLLLYAILGSKHFLW